MAKQPLSAAPKAAPFTPEQLAAALQAHGGKLMFTVAAWEPLYYPFTPERASVLCLKYAAELAECGALVRIGKEKVVIATAYLWWLLQHKDQVTNYDVPANRPEHAAKRFGHGKQRGDQRRSARRRVKTAVARTA